MKIVAIVEARMASTRLPGKVLLEVLDVPMLGRLINRLKQVSFIQEIVIATTTNREDDDICTLATDFGVHFYRGSENDVMSRVLEAALKANADVIVEITGDCPIIDIDVIADVIRQFLEGSYDYVSNSNIRSFPQYLSLLANTNSNPHPLSTLPNVCKFMVVSQLFYLLSRRPMLLLHS